MNGYKGNGKGYDQGWNNNQGYGGQQQGYGGQQQGYGQQWGNQEYRPMPEKIMTSSGQAYRGDERFKVFVDPPVGEAVIMNRADILILPTAAINRLRDILPLVPLHGTEEEWQAWKTLASQGGQIYPGKTEDELWTLAGMPVARRATVATLATQIETQNAALTNQMTQLTTQLANVATIAANAANLAAANTNGDTSAAPKRKVRAKKA